MDNLKSAMAEPPAAPRGIPLDLGPLLQPYLRHGHLSLKIERLPSGARFSRGSNNADRTWSLTVNDIKGLLYIPPKGMEKAHTLSVRVLSLEEDYGATLALLDVPVSPANAMRLDDEAELVRLRDEVAAKQAALAERESALAQQRGGGAGASRQQIDAAIAAARKSWEAELQKRLAEAAASASAELERSRAAWQSEQEVRLAAASARVQETVATSRDRARQEVEAALAKAQEGWKAAEASRLAAVEAKWRQETERAVTAAMEKLRQVELHAAEAHAASQAKDARERSDNAELARLREELAAKQAALAKAESDAAALRAATDETRRGAKTEIEAALKAAEGSWKAGEAARLAAAEARWREEAAQSAGQAAERIKQIEAALAEAQKEAKAARERGDQAELKKLREAVAAKDVTLAKQEKELEALGVAAQKASEKARDFAKAELQAALKKAEDGWKSAEAQRLAAAETRRREESQAEAEAVSRADAARAKLEGEIKALRAEGEKAREQAKAELDAALKRAEEHWKSGEAAKLATAEARLRQQLEPALAEAKARAERAETALAEGRKDGKGGRKGEDAEVKRLRDELAAKQVALAERDADLAQARAALDQAKADQQSALWQAESAWRAEEAERVAAAETRFREQSRQAITEATERFERAEAELKEERALARTVHNRGDDAEIRRLKDELAAIQAKLDESDVSLSEARAAAEAQARAAAENEAARLKLEEAHKAEAAQRLTADPAEHDPAKPRSRRDGMRGRFANAIVRQRQMQILRYGLRGIVVAAALVGAVIVYPRVEAVVAKSVWPKIVTVASSIKSINPFAGGADEPAPRRVAKVEPVISERRTVIAASSANVRNGPSPDAGVIATLYRGEEVSPVDHRGIWVQIRFGSDNPEHRQEGWVFGSLLKEESER